MMCWENLEGFLEEKPNKEISNQDERPDDDKEKPNYDEAQEHDDCTLHTSNQLKISIEEFSSGTKDDLSTLATQETSQKKLVYITNLKKDS